MPYLLFLKKEQKFWIVICCKLLVAPLPASVFCWEPLQTFNALIVFLKEFFEKINFEKKITSADDKKACTQMDKC